MNGAFNRTAGYSLLKNVDIIYVSFVLLINTCINLVNETNIKGAIAIAFAPEIDCSQSKIISPDLVLQILLLLSLLSLLFFCFGQFLFADSLVVLLDRVVVVLLQPLPNAYSRCLSPLQCV
ncbi:hypothetical protein NC651_034647 [Populus alba x Populus x berolinensis]|nr:hypothetical protein NC651_034639 [Populus alba x Populus x berolinensis]KAJ6863894.1 hypothetical protein NC651_034647 [Populus alba x Populus x berolinensis]